MIEQVRSITDRVLGVPGRRFRMIQSSYLRAIFEIPSPIKKVPSGRARYLVDAGGSGVTYMRPMINRSKGGPEHPKAG